MSIGHTRLWHYMYSVIDIERFALGTRNVICFVSANNHIDFNQRLDTLKSIFFVCKNRKSEY